MLIAATGTAQTWSQEEINLFTESCMNEAKAVFTEAGAKEYCDCSVIKVMALYPDAEEVDNLTEQEINTIATECMEPLLEKEGVLLTGWPDEAKKGFLEACEEELIGSGIDAKKYCPCALEEVILLYPTPMGAAELSEEELDKIVEKCMQ